jgi:hypothetical protein
MERAKTFISLVKMIDELKKNDVIEETDICLRICFDDFMQGVGLFKDCINVRIIRVSVEKANHEMKVIDWNEIFKVADGINVWLNTGKQLKHMISNFGLVKCLHVFDGDLPKKSFTNNKGEVVEFYKISEKKLKGEGKGTMNKFIKALEEAEVKRVEMLAEKCNEEIEELSEDFI